MQLSIDGAEFPRHPRAEGAPIVASFGCGTNSTAVLILMHERGERPALIMMADTGDEMPHTYRHLDVMQEWCARVGFPPITVVRNMLPLAITDGSLYGESLRRGTLPSRAFGGSGCSLKWKVDPQYRHLATWMRENGVDFVRHFVGFDAGEAHRATKPGTLRAVDARSGFESNEYPLIEAGWERDECIAAIARAGLPQPGKSACFMCPSSTKAEVRWLKSTYPVLYLRAVELERRALAGEGESPIARVDGLGRHWNWGTFEGQEAGTPEPCGACMDGEPDPQILIDFAEVA